MIDNLFTFREAMEYDFQRIAEFFQRHNYGLRKVEWLEWKYLKNPMGQGRIFLMEDSQKAIKGTVGFIPRLFRGPGDDPLVVMEAVDFFVAPESRGQKMAKKILGFGVESVNRPVIGFPNKLSEKVTIRGGWKALGPLKRWYFPTNSFSSLLNPLLNGYQYIFLRKKNRKIRMEPVTAFKHDFNEGLSLQIKGRSAKFLNWRFIDHPLRKYSCFEFWEGERVIGYCIMSTEGSSSEIYDFFSPQHERHCLRTVFDYCSQNGTQHIFFRGMGLKLWKYGFLNLPAKIKLVSPNLTSRSFILTLGDSDW